MSSITDHMNCSQSINDMLDTQGKNNCLYTLYSISLNFVPVHEKNYEYIYYVNI